MAVHCRLGPPYSLFFRPRFRPPPTKGNSPFEVVVVLCPPPLSSSSSLLLSTIIIIITCDDDKHKGWWYTHTPHTSYNNKGQQCSLVLIQSRLVRWLVCEYGWLAVHTPKKKKACGSLSYTYTHSTAQHSTQFCVLCWRVCVCCCCGVRLRWGRNVVGIVSVAVAVAVAAAAAAADMIPRCYLYIYTYRGRGRGE